MKLINFLLLTVLFVTAKTHSQNTNSKNKVTTYYYKENNEVKEIGRVNPKSILVFEPELKALLTPADKNKDLTTQAAVFLVKQIIDKVGSLIYKPEKFSKSNSAKKQLISLNESTKIESLDNEKLIYLSVTEKPKNNQLSQILHFSIHNNPDKKNFKILKFDSYFYRYTSVKLKKRHHKVNLLIDLQVSYFDDDGLLQKIDLESIELNNIIPKGSETKLTKVEQDIFRYIPTKFQIESIKITVNEINARKNVWDKWLKLYNDNKDKIKETIVDKIEGE